MSVALKKEGNVVLENCRVANSFWSRFMGLMGKTEVSPEPAVIFPRCSSIHTFFMRMPIDVLFVDKQGQVVKVLANLSPWKLLLPIPRAKHAIEMAAGQAGVLGLSMGDSLSCEGVF